MKNLKQLLFCALMMVTGGLAHLKGQERTLVYQATPSGSEFRNSTEKPPLKLNEINIDAMRDFTKKFSGATNVKWVNRGRLTSVYFTDAGVQSRSTYDKNRGWEYTLRYYDESKMPPRIRHLVKRTYYDFSILLVTEVQRPGQLQYFVKMEDKFSFLTVLAIDGEVTEFESYGKK